MGLLLWHLLLKNMSSWYQTWLMPSKIFSPVLESMAKLPDNIIGEPFANQIDSAIQLLNDKLLASIRKNYGLSVKLHEYTNGLGKDPTDRFPCLTESSSTRLLFKSQNSRVRLN
jgi:hypothetical protein